MKNIYYIDGIKYICKSYKYDNYKMRYELYKKNKLWYAIIESYNDDNKIIEAADKSKKNAEQKLIFEFENYVKAGTIDNLIRQGYKFSPEYPDVMLSARDMLIGYHISESKNRSSIISNGLIANGNEDIEVRKASQLIDLYRPRSIPKDIIREQAIYLWPMMTNYTFGYSKKNMDIYAVNIGKLQSSWVGSQGIGGFCLYYDEEYTDEQNEQFRIKSIDNAKDYWKYSCSLNNYLSNNFWTSKKDKYVGLDEIITCQTIDPKDLILIGYWDDNGIFNEEPLFINYIKPEFKNCYKNILKKYMEK